MSKTNGNSQAPRADVYTRVTDRIVSDLEKGVRPWMKPWSASNAEDRLPSLPLRHNGQPYRGVNILLLWGEAIEKGYTRNIWMTYKQAEDFGAHVRKGEHGALIEHPACNPCPPCSRGKARRSRGLCTTGAPTRRPSPSLGVYFSRVMSFRLGCFRFHGLFRAARPRVNGLPDPFACAPVLAMTLRASSPRAFKPRRKQPSERSLT